MKVTQDTATVYLDIMLNGKFVKQLPYRYCPLFVIDSEDVKEYVEERMPSMKGRNYIINFSNQRV